MKELVLKIVENQLASGKPEETGLAYDELIDMGCSHDEAVQVISAAVLAELYRVMDTGETYDETEFMDFLEEVLQGQEPEILTEGRNIPEHLDLEKSLQLTNPGELLDMTLEEYDLEPEDDPQDSASKLADYLLNPDVMRHVFLFMSDEVKEEFDAALHREFLEDNGFVYPFNAIYDAGDIEDYLFYADDGRVIVPDDVAEAYALMHTDEFEFERKQYLWIRDCLLTAAYYYGVLDMHVLLQMTSLDPEMKIDKDKLYDIINDIPEKDRIFARVGEKLIYRDLLDDYDWMELERLQNGWHFVLPDIDEIRDIGKYHYPYHDECWRQLTDAFNDAYMMMDAMDIMSFIFHYVVMGADSEMIQKEMNSPQAEMDNIEYEHAFLSCYQHTRLLLLRGGKRDQGKDPAKLPDTLMQEMLELDNYVDTLPCAEPDDMFTFENHQKS